MVVLGCEGEIALVYTAQTLLSSAYFESLLRKSALMAQLGESQQIPPS